MTGDLPGWRAILGVAVTLMGHGGHADWVLGTDQVVRCTCGTPLFELQAVPAARKFAVVTGGRP